MVVYVHQIHPSATPLGSCYPFINKVGCFIPLDNIKTWLFLWTVVKTYYIYGICQQSVDFSYFPSTAVFFFKLAYESLE